MNKTKKIRIYQGSGNVFADLGFPNAEREQLKARMALQIYRLIKSRRITQAKAGEILGIRLSLPPPVGLRRLIPQDARAMGLHVAVIESPCLPDRFIVLFPHSTGGNRSDSWVLSSCSLLRPTVEEFKMKDRVRRGAFLFLAFLAISDRCSAQTLNMSHQLVSLGIASQNLTPNNPSLDARPLINAAAQYAQSNHYATITLDQGSYYLLSAQASYTVLDFSNLST